MAYGTNVIVTYGMRSLPYGTISRRTKCNINIIKVLNTLTISEITRLHLSEMCVFAELLSSYKLFLLIIMMLDTRYWMELS